MGTQVKVFKGWELQLNTVTAFVLPSENDNTGQFFK